jgi:hypothetical protein
MKEELRAFVGILNRRCNALGEPSAHLFLVRIMAIAAADAFVGFEAIYRCGEDTGALSLLLLLLSMFGAVCFAVFLSVFVVYVLGLSIDSSRARVHYTSW